MGTSELNALSYQNEWFLCFSNQMCCSLQALWLSVRKDRKSVVGANGNSFSNVVSRQVFFSNIFLIIAAAALSTPVIPKLKELAEKIPSRYYFMRSAGIVMNAAILIISSLLLLNTTNNPFLYFRF